MSASRTGLLFAGLALVSLHVAPANSQEQAQGKADNKVPPGQPAVKPRLDRGKMKVIEPSITSVIRNASTPAPGAPIGPPAGFTQFPGGAARPMDFGKTLRIEPAVKAVVKNATAPAPAREGFVNPKVPPGKVTWHPSFAAACEAAKKSKKPVLLFQLMGKLDDQFC
jgi:hypothetical protein